MKPGTIALIVSGVAVAAGGAYYVLVYRKAQTNAVAALNTIQQTVTANQVQPSQYEGQLIRSPDTGKVYIVTNGYKQWITSPAVLSRMGYSMSQVKDLSPSIIDTIPTGTSLSGIRQFGFGLLRN